MGVGVEAPSDELDVGDEVMAEFSCSVQKGKVLAASHGRFTIRWSGLLGWTTIETLESLEDRKFVVKRRGSWMQRLFSGNPSRSVRRNVFLPNGEAEAEPATSISDADMRRILNEQSEDDRQDLEEER